jgi:hypothetical protein
VLWGTLSPTCESDPAAVTGLFRRRLPGVAEGHRQVRRSVDPGLRQHRRSTPANYTFCLYTKDGETKSNPAATALHLLVKDGNDWKIVDHHSSAECLRLRRQLPRPPAAAARHCPSTSNGERARLTSSGQQRMLAAALFLSLVDLRAAAPVDISGGGRPAVPRFPARGARIPGAWQLAHIANHQGKKPHDRRQPRSKRV